MPSVAPVVFQFKKDCNSFVEASVVGIGTNVPLPTLKPCKVGSVSSFTEGHARTSGVEKGTIASAARRA